MTIPVVVFAYARPIHLQQMLDSLRVNGVARMYVFSDAPRTPDKEPLVAEVRRIIRAIDWCDCTVIERVENLGLGKSILSGMSEVFRQEEMAIVFEDDLVCVPGTYQYLAAALEHYRNTPQVMSVTGWTHPRVVPSDVVDQPYFDGRAECWGWGTYARSWEGMDVSAKEVMLQCQSQGMDIYRLGSDLPPMAELEARQNIWAVRWVYLHMLKRGLCLRPPHSMIEHIGFDAQATNASDATQLANPPLQSAPPIPDVWPRVKENPECGPKWRRFYPPPQKRSTEALLSLDNLRRNTQVKAWLIQLIPPLALDLFRLARNHGIRRAAKRLMPPILIDFLRRIRSRSSLSPVRPEWEYVPSGWEAVRRDSHIKGWDEPSILDSYIERWPSFVKSVESQLPLGISPEALENDHKNVSFHNVVMSFGYALAIAAGTRRQLSMLDWGGGIGHYYLLSKALLPDVNIDYTCKDLPVFATYGKTLFPEARFIISDEEVRQQRYSFVLMSSSIHYVEHWQELLQICKEVASGYVYITRVPTVHHTPSYVMVQRPYEYGYNTEYMGWCINRLEFLREAREVGLELVREFIIENPPHIHNAPEQCDYWGYLFRAGPTALGGEYT